MVGVFDYSDEFQVYIVKTQCPINNYIFVNIK